MRLFGYHIFIKKIPKPSTIPARTADDVLDDLCRTADIATDLWREMRQYDRRTSLWIDWDKYKIVLSQRDRSGEVFIIHDPDDRLNK